MNEVNDGCTDVTLTDGSVDMSHAEKRSELTADQSHFFLNHVIENVTLSEKPPLTWKCLTDSWVSFLTKQTNRKTKQKNPTLLLMNESD